MNKTSKSKAASKVLKLMDEDFSYIEALEKVLNQDKRLSKSKLEKELKVYIYIRLNKHRKVMNQTQKIQFWMKLNRKPMSVYLRFQRLFARKNNGKWIRGCTINSIGIVTFILE